MQYTKSLMAVAAMLGAVAQAAPLEATLKAPLEARQASSVNDCGDSTFINQSSPGSPLISDCQQIATNIANGGTWTVYEGDSYSPPTIVVTYGTCVMDVKGQNGNDGQFNIGNQDIIDIINSSIDQFGWNGLVGAMGTTSCQGWLSFSEAYTSPVDWRLYHT